MCFMQLYNKCDSSHLRMWCDTPITSLPKVSFDQPVCGWTRWTFLPVPPRGCRMAVRSQADPQRACLPAAAVTGPHKSPLSPPGGTRCFCPSHVEGLPPWWLQTVCRQWGSWRLEAPIPLFSANRKQKLIFTLIQSTFVGQKPFSTHLHSSSLSH